MPEDLIANMFLMSPLGEKQKLHLDDVGCLDWIIEFKIHASKWRSDLLYFVDSKFLVLNIPMRTRC